MERTSRRRRVSRPVVVELAGVVLIVVLIGAIAQRSVAAAASPPCPNEALRTPPSSQLPDCRAYEQVSPVEKHGESAAEAGLPAQVVPDGEALMYVSFAAFENPLSNSLPNAYVARRSAGGWETANDAPPTPDATPPGGDLVGYDFSTDLARWVVNLPLQELAPGATPGVSNLFLTDGSGAYSWVNDVRPPVVPPEGCAPSFLAFCYELEDLVSFAGASADYRHVLFEATASLARGAPEEEGVENLYESVEGAGGERHVSLVGVLPDGAAAHGSTAGAGSSVFYTTIGSQFDRRVAGAISADGSRVIFQAPADGGAPEPAQAGMTELYDRIGASETIELSAPAAGATPQLTAPEPATYWAASADGARVFFTSRAELTTQSYTGATEPTGEDLYEYDLETKALKDLTVDANLPADEAEGAAVQGVLGISGDGSNVYFVAKGQLVPGKGVDQGENLYMVHNGGAPVFIATLNESDGNDWSAVPVALESYITPDGMHVAFASVNSLPTVNFPGGYDNVNESTGNAEREVYEYTAPNVVEEAHGLSGSMTCVSCDPSGARPIGPGVIAGGRLPEGFRNGESTPFHQARAMSDSGRRVFFTSEDPLVTAARGSTQLKIYEYEQNGEGSCETPGGCIYLLSSPSPPEPTSPFNPETASFLGTDSEGDNVFFATFAQLTPSDQDKQADVYDARVGGGFSSPPVQAPCSAGCREPAGEPASLAPLSESAAPSGNLSLPGLSKKSTRKTHAQIRAQKLARALRACRKMKAKRRRRLCEARARKRYRPRAKVKQASSGTGGRQS